MQKKHYYGCGSQGDRQLQVMLIDLEIRQREAVIREQQTVINQLKARKSALLAPRRKKRRRCPWEADTPMIRLVNLSQMEHFLALMNDWQKRSTETIYPKKTSQFTFLPNAKSSAIRALALILLRDFPVFKVSSLELCRYLSAHSNLGTPEAIREGLYRARKLL
jgi:hypothetical protein